MPNRLILLRYCLIYNREIMNKGDLITIVAEEADIFKQGPSAVLPKLVHFSSCVSPLRRGHATQGLFSVWSGAMTIWGTSQSAAATQEDMGKWLRGPPRRKASPSAGCPYATRMGMVGAPPVRVIPFRNCSFLFSRLVTNHISQ